MGRARSGTNRCGSKATGALPTYLPAQIGGGILASTPTLFVICFACHYEGMAATRWNTAVAALDASPHGPAACGFHNAWWGGLH